MAYVRQAMAYVRQAMAYVRQTMACNYFSILIGKKPVEN